jgi:hypothetical protein
MIKIMNAMPANVVGFIGEGKITGKDYETVLIPAVENALKINKKIRLIYQIGSSFTSFDLAAMLDDSKVGMKHLFVWEKVAFVSDLEIVNIITKFFGYIMPCEVRVFKNAELQEAKKWINEN